MCGLRPQQTSSTPSLPWHPTKHSSRRTPQSDPSLALPQAVLPQLSHIRLRQFHFFAARDIQLIQAYESGVISEKHARKFLSLDNFLNPVQYARHEIPIKVGPLPSDYSNSTLIDRIAQ